MTQRTQDTDFFILHAEVRREIQTGVQMSHCYLRTGNDTLDQATACDSVEQAKRMFQREAEDLARFGQEIDATIHIANNACDVVEDADYYLSLGPRGGLRCERC